MHQSICLNISRYPWKCFNKLFWLYQGSKYAWSSYMFDRLFKMTWVVNVSWFWIWHGCRCKGYTEFWICLNMTQYASICLNMPWRHTVRSETIFVNLKPFKHDEKSFLFHPKALFVLKMFKFLSWLFGQVAKQLD